jgi:MFS family permease
VAWRTPQFWLLWSVLTLNVTAGIGVLGMASPLLQEVFGGRLIGVKASYDELTPQQLSVIAATAAGFTGLLSLFNILGRIFWASLSDQIGRQATYMVFFLFGAALYAAIPWTADDGSLGLFVAFFCIILSMYGGGFAAVPAYLADLFGSRMVSAIHGRLLTAWATAGVLGPVLVNYIREYQLSHGVPKAEAYSVKILHDPGADRRARRDQQREYRGAGGIRRCLDRGDADGPGGGRLARCQHPLALGGVYHLPEGHRALQSVI